MLTTRERLATMSAKTQAFMGPILDDIEKAFEAAICIPESLLPADCRGLVDTREETAWVQTDGQYRQERCVPVSKILKARKLTKRRENRQNDLDSDLQFALELIASECLPEAEERRAVESARNDPERTIRIHEHMERVSREERGA